MVIVNKQNNIQLINNFLNQSIMKKSLFAILAVAACFASCSEVIESEVLDNPISFDNYVGKDATTRASVVQGVKSVRVNAFLRPTTSPTGMEHFLANFMNNQEVKWVADEENTELGSWEYNPAKFWPAADQVVDFVAWVPVADYTDSTDVVGNNITVTGAKMEFTVPEEVKYQSDLLVAEAQMGLNRAADNQPVNLNFKHLLSRVGFEIVATGIPADDVTVVELVEVSLKGNFAKSGVVDMTKDNKTTENTLAITAAANGTTTKRYKLRGKHFGWDDNKMTNATKDVTSGALVGRKNSDDSYIMLIPDGNTPSTITVTYTITTDKGKPTQTVITNTADFDLQPASGTPFAYEAGKAYKYIFKITLQSITFDVEVEDWDTETTTDITPVDPNQGNQPA